MKYEKSDEGCLERNPFFRSETELFGRFQEHRNRTQGVNYRENKKEHFYKIHHTRLIISGYIIRQI